VMSWALECAVWTPLAHPVVLKVSSRFSIRAGRCSYIRLTECDARRSGVRVTVRSLVRLYQDSSSEGSDRRLRERRGVVGPVVAFGRNWRTPRSTSQARTSRTGSVTGADLRTVRSVARTCPDSKPADFVAGMPVKRGPHRYRLERPAPRAPGATFATDQLAMRRPLGPPGGRCQKGDRRPVKGMALLWW